MQGRSSWSTAARCVGMSRRVWDRDMALSAAAPGMFDGEQEPPALKQKKGKRMDSSVLPVHRVLQHVRDTHPWPLPLSCHRLSYPS